jgi:hypothetical protein
MGQRAGNSSEFQRIFGGEVFDLGGGGGTYSLSLADVRILASDRKVAHLLESAETGFQPLFDDFDAVDGGRAVFSAELTPGDGSLAELLLLDVAGSSRRKGLVIHIYCESMLRYLGANGDDALAELQLAFNARPGTAGGAEQDFNEGRFKHRRQIQGAVNFVAERIIQSRRGDGQ